MKIFYPKSHYDASHRGHVFPLLKAFIKNKTYTDVDRFKDYGVSDADFQIVDEPSKAEHILLTMSWWYYLNTNTLTRAIVFIEKMNTLGFKVWIHIPGDADLDIPKHLNVNILVQQGYTSKLRDDVFCYPPFIDDPLKAYFQTTTKNHREFNSKPTLGFCGYADGNLYNALKEVTKISIKNLLYRLNIKPQKPHHVRSSVYKRFQILKRLEFDKRLQSNFILRKNYRAGLIDNKVAHKSTIDFFDNINNSDYVFCYRGAGNFSIRFYQTLAMGRIPVFINTDCILPFENQIDWKNYVIWVEEENEAYISDNILDFHSGLNTETLNKQFQKNRELWETHLRLGSFFKFLFESQKKSES